MAPDVIDLVSSSPPRSALPPAQHLPATSNRDGGNGAPKRPALTDLVSLSDDFDLSDDGFDPFAAADPGRKRRRTSSPPRPSMPAPSCASRPPLLVGRAVPRSRKALDPIEVSSSLEQAPPKNRPPGSPRGAPWDISSPAIRLASPKPLAIPVDSDPFASSPEPLRRPAKSPGQPARRAVSLDPFESSPIPAVASPFKPSATQRSPSPSAGARVYDLTTSRHDLHSHRRPAQPLQSERATEFSGTHVISIDDSDSSAGSDDSEFPDIADIEVSRRRYKPRSPLRRTRSENITRSNTGADRVNRRRPIDKEARAATKAAERERKRRDREHAKAAKALEKERAAALAEVNKLRTDKKVSTPEMIVDLPSSLAAEHRVQLEVLLEGLGVEHTTWQSPDQSIVKWRRKVASRFDEDLGRWEPIPPRIHEEKHVLTILTADEFVGLVTRDELQAHASKTKDKFARHHTIYLLQGMTVWLRKNRNLRNRQFTSEVRAHQAPANPRGQRRNEASSAEYIPEDLVEDAMLRLQVEHDVFIHHTMIAAETAKWVATFTQHISTIPYRKQKDHATSTAGFCMESGQVRTGEGPRDTYVKMLQEIVRITAPIAYGVAAEFDSVTKLVQGLETGGPERLDGVRKSANKDGQLSDRTVGQAVSRRVYKVFTGRDEGSTDV